MSRAKRKLVRRVRVTREPFFRVDGEPFVDVFFEFGSALPVDCATLAEWIFAAPVSTIVIGRRMTVAEVRLMRRSRRDADHATCAQMFPTEQQRWKPLPSKKLK